jgi:hypothetical protein
LKEGHPIDDLMARDRGLARIRRRALRCLKRLQARPDADAVLDFEAERNHLDAARVEAAYNVGFEGGLIAGRLDGLRTRAGRARSAEEIALARAMRSALSSARLPPGRAEAVLLELAWAIVLGVPRGDGRRQSATRRRGK